MPKTSRFVLLALSVSLMLALPAQARKLKIETIRSDPFGYEDNRGKGGMMYEISNLIADTAGLEYENRVVPYARTVLSLREGTADMVLRFNNEELATVALQVTPVVGMQTVVLTRADTRINSLADLHDKVLAVVRSFPVDKSISDDKAIRTYVTDSNEHSVRMLFAGRVDAILGSDVGMYGAAKTLGYASSKFAAPLKMDVHEFWLHYSRKTADEATIKTLKAAVEKLQRQGAFTRIQQNYLPAPQSQR